MTCWKRRKRRVARRGRAGKQRVPLCWYHRSRGQGGQYEGIGSSINLCPHTPPRPAPPPRSAPVPLAKTLMHCGTGSSLAALTYPWQQEGSSGGEILGCGRVQRNGSRAGSGGSRAGSSGSRAGSGGSRVGSGGRRVGSGGSDGTSGLMDWRRQE
ncbi:hypothetical protein C8J57DRAFT_1214168 [Mycena rebaudengoi]|nr:hypothetical protein C8J57DRAFT_1214168 [Mycena rebaudengoi]